MSPAPRRSPAPSRNPASRRSPAAGATASRGRGPSVDGRQQHLDWLALVDVTGPFLTVPVLTRAWPTLDAVDQPTREALRLAHADRRTDPAGWLGFVQHGLLGWGDALHTDGMAALAMPVTQHDTTLTPTFTLVEPGTDTPALLGLVHPAGTHPTGRIGGDPWPATPVDRAALLCRHHDVPLALVTDGRWWALVWAPRGGVTGVAVFDSVTWPESADRVVVRAFASLLHRRRFFGVPQAERLPVLLADSRDNQEEVTETLGVQVRRAVEQLVDAIGRHDLRVREAGEAGLADVPAEQVYRAAVSVMMRVVFLLFAEERGLLPADNPVYEAAYSAGRLCDELKQRADATGSEEELEHSTAAWRRLLALFTAVYYGIHHPRVAMPAYDGSIFDPDRYPWLAGVAVDDRTVLHMLRSVQYVVIKRELRRLSFRAIDVEQIGYVYEGLLSFDGYRAEQTVVGLIGKAGLEEEVPLADLEHLADTHRTPQTLANGIAAAYKDSGIGTAKSLERKLTPPDGAERTEAIRRLLAAAGGDRNLAERLLPFVGILREDLRGLPTVIREGALYVTASPLRRNTGTHYTPRFLAEQVVEGALEPLVYAPGPLQTADRTQWALRPSTDILALRVADIAMGSGAFLVAACRYLACRLVEAWSVEGHIAAREYLADTRRIDATDDAEADPVMIDARREIIQHCLYGVDINPMAVEMAKLSLWLVSMDPTRPFTFLDDRLVAGDSLLGVTSIDQIEALHLDPARGHKLHEDTIFAELDHVRPLIEEIANDRRKLAGRPGNDLAAVVSKRESLAAIQARTAQAASYADLIVGAALAHAGRGTKGLDAASLAVADQVRVLSSGTSEAADTARQYSKAWLATDLPSGAFTRQPLHWPLAFPEVFEAGGFDAIIGNPPFLGGQKLTGALGPAYREHLVHGIGGGARGSADLVAYFLLRAHTLLSGRGQTGLIATNTLTQGDTREIGLDQIVATGVEIRQAVKSRPWPSKSAVLQYCAVWTSHPQVAAEVPRVLDEITVTGINTALDARSRVGGPAHRLAANSGIAFQGSNILGLGFTMEPARARRLITTDRRNADVLFPYLNGQDLNSSPEGAASRWVINFHDWPQERAATHGECFEQVERLVKPERARNNRAVRRDRWWQFAERAPALYGAIRGLERVVVITLVSKVVMPVMVPTGQVFAHKLGVFASDDPALLGLLSSAAHYWWAITRSSTMKADLNYSPTDVFETFARPELTGELRVAGERLDGYRRELMLARQAGLTATYNLVHNPVCLDPDIVELRRIHVTIDEAVARAYGWNDLLSAGLDHGFHETRQGIRYTVGPVVRQEILDRLLELNQERYAAEQISRPARARGRRMTSNQSELF
ncbi:MAG: SAM-dependent DNA methyltransferase [Micromonosporaceae bacterium]|nr:SAM-dependent DNA methyltransferase [Micromonosporaceae bacterium]